MKIKGNTREIAEAKVELVPLIDCVFLLLIFFMCAATMSTVDLASDINLPVASNAAEQKDPGRRGTVNIMRAGVRTSQGDLVTEAKPFLVFGELVNEEGLQKAIEEHLKIEPTMRLYLRADRDAKFSKVRRAMGACASAGVSDVIFGTHVQDLYLKEKTP